jgi:hypothetical protein
LGPTEEQGFTEGRWYVAKTHRYDQRGNPSETLSFDSNGTLIASQNTTWDEKGRPIEEWDRGPENSFQVHYIISFDDKNHIETHISFRENGSVGVHFVVQDSKLLSYWQRQPVPAKPELGSMIFLDTGPKITEARKYHAEGTFDRMVYLYFDEEKQKISCVQWYDTKTVVPGSVNGIPADGAWSNSMNVAFPSSMDAPVIVPTKQIPVGLVEP